MTGNNEATVTVDDEKGARTYRCDELDCHLVAAYEEYAEFC